ncbi:MAG: family 43 glycosylhydrolase [Verrucomicrobiota bacterium]
MKCDDVRLLPRRSFLRSAAAGALGAKPLMAGLAGALATGCASMVAPTKSGSTIDPREERQPSGDLGNGFYKNPVVITGNFADLSVIRVGRDYYIPKGQLIWHSRDLVNWEPIRCRQKVLGIVDTIVQLGDEFRIYAGNLPGYIAAARAKHPLGPWSDPITFPGESFDISYMKGLDGKDYLIGGGGPPDCGVLFELAPDGMSVVREQKLGYMGWPIPEDWDVEGFFLEGWNTITKGGYHYLLTAEGGTAGPPTSHMALAARSKNPNGPWENSPYNPIVHTYSKDEPFWSQGQGVLVDTPEGEWYMMYHGYLKDQRYLGRNAFLLPVEWTSDGWFRVLKGIKSDQPIRKPKGGEAVPHGFKLNDDFPGPELDIKWSFGGREASPEGRYRFVQGGLALQGFTPWVPMIMPITHRAYEFVTEMTVPAGAEGGAVIYANARLYTSVSVKGDTISGHGMLGGASERKNFGGGRIFFRMVCQDGLGRLYYGPDGKQWKHLAMTSDISHYDHTIYGGGGVHPGMFAAGSGEVIVHNFRVKGLA